MEICRSGEGRIDTMWLNLKPGSYARKWESHGSLNKYKLESGFRCKCSNEEAFFVPCSRTEVRTARTSSVPRRNSRPCSRSAARPGKNHTAPSEIPVRGSIYKLHLLQNIKENKQTSSPKETGLFGTIPPASPCTFRTGSWALRPCKGRRCSGSRPRPSRARSPFRRPRSRCCRLRLLFLPRFHRSAQTPRAERCNTLCGAGTRRAPSEIFCRNISE